jgi:CDP-diacylglycerol--glycerol-3-phosphate 3-phosphatidyltransferase
MNLANKITVVRVLMIPIFLVVLLTGLLPTPLNRYVATGIFIVASLTDALDGYIARSRNMITNLGKFMDPLADKLLVVSAMVALVELRNLSAWVVIIIVAREFIVTGFRVIAASNNIVIAASWWGKLKTTSQMLMVIFLLVNFNGVIFVAVDNLLIALATAFTLISGVDYIVKNINVLKD